MALDSRFAEHLRAGCPVLEYLELAYCRTEFSHIRSGTLKNLAIEYCSSRSIHSLVIIAPRLVSLRLLIRVRDGTVSLYGVNSLVEASIDVSNCQMSPSGEAMLLGALFSATNLELKGTRAMVSLPYGRSYLVCVYKK